MGEGSSWELSSLVSITWMIPDVFSFLLKRGFRSCLAGSRRRCLFLLDIGIVPTRRGLWVGLHRGRQTYRVRQIKKPFLPPACTDNFSNHWGGFHENRPSRGVGEGDFLCSLSNGVLRLA